MTCYLMAWLVLNTGHYIISAELSENQSSVLIRTMVHGARPVLVSHTLESNHAPRLTHRKSVLIGFKNVGFKSTPLMTPDERRAATPKGHSGLHRFQASKCMLLRSIRIATPPSAVTSGTARYVRLRLHGRYCLVETAGGWHRPFPTEGEERSPHKSFAAHA
jgi:hypothetical protein